MISHMHSADHIATQVIRKIQSNLTITLDSTGKHLLGSNEIPKETGYTPISAQIANFSSSDLGGNAIPPTVVLAENGSFYILGSPSKTYNSIAVSAVLLKS